MGDVPQRLLGPRRVVNLTPHRVTVLDAAGRPLLSVPASGTVARISEILEPGGALEAGGTLVPTSLVRYAEEIDGLPAPSHGTAYVVSRVLAQTVRRSDLYFPAEEVRDETGQIIGCRSLGQFTQKGGA